MPYKKRNYLKATISIDEHEECHRKLSGQLEKIVKTPKS
jgi:hypothetical protein